MKIAWISETYPTFGNVILEAMASRLEVVAYDYAAPRAYIEHGKHGWLVPFNDSLKFQEKIIEKLGDPSNCQPRLGLAARAKAEESPWSNIISTLETGLWSL